MIRAPGIEVRKMKPAIGRSTGTSQPAYVRTISVDVSTQKMAQTASRRPSGQSLTGFFR
jgi:hypothetical protein